MGLEPGPAVARAIRAVETEWAEAGFPEDRQRVRDGDLSAVVRVDGNELLPVIQGAVHAALVPTLAPASLHMRR